MNQPVRMSGRASAGRDQARPNSARSRFSRPALDPAALGFVHQTCWPISRCRGSATAAAIDRLRRAGRALAHHRNPAAPPPPEKIQRPGPKASRKGVGDVLVRVDLAIDVQLAQGAGDQLRDLAAENRMISTSWSCGSGRQGCS